MYGGPSEQTLNVLVTAMFEKDEYYQNKKNIIKEKFLIDGGSLLEIIPWKKDQTFECIAQGYADFVQRHYKYAHAIFDGYSNSKTTKCQTHMRQQHELPGPSVNFTKST